MAWHDNDSFWETWAPYLFSSERLRNAAHELEQLIELLQVPRDARILDLCCGTGRHSLELARRGYQVTGVDWTRSYLDRARAQAAAENLEVKFLQCDARSMGMREQFDCAINMFTSFGYFDSDQDNLRVLACVRDALTPGGRLLIETEGKEVMARDFCERQWWWHEDGTIGLQERKVSGEWDRMETRWILIRDRQVVWDGMVRSHIYSAAEMRSLIEKAGFSRVTCYGSLDGAPYDQRATGLIAVAVK
jgi:SAM-dependent methyltransferase